MKHTLLLLFLLPWIVTCTIERDNPYHRVNIDYKAPEIVGISKGLESSIEIEWKAAQNDIDQFIIYRGVDKNTISEIARVSGSRHSYKDIFSSPSDKTFYYALEAVLIAGEISRRSNIAAGDFDAPIIFKDANLEKAVRDIIGKAAGNIYLKDTADYTHMDMHNKNIKDLSGIEYLTGLTKLDLDNNQISDLSPLSSLKGLQSLDLWGNRISSIHALSPLTNLTELNLAQNSITGISALSSLQKLNKLHLNDNTITNIYPLATLTKLTILDIDNNQISDITPLSLLKGMTSLDLWGNRINSISALLTLTALHEVNLRHNMITDIQTLLDNPGLTAGDTVYLGNNPLVTGADHPNRNQIDALKAIGITVDLEETNLK